MRITPAEHAKHPWRVSEIADDFKLIDAWALPATGERHEFLDLLRIWASTAGAENRRGPVKILFVVREWIGGKFGWDNELNTLPIPGTDQLSLRERLPAELSAGVVDEYEFPPFRPVLLTDTESVSELSNSLLHAILQLGWAEQRDGTYQGHLGVYVKHRGRLGKPYMVLIAPFRHYLVYPALLRSIDRAWQQRNR